jgi:hypothetical protein
VPLTETYELDAALNFEKPLCWPITKETKKMPVKLSFQMHQQKKLTRIILIYKWSKFKNRKEEKPNRNFILTQTTKLI